MATKKKESPAGYDRWDTFTGTTKGTGKLTETQKKAIERVQKKQKSGKKK